MKQCRYLSVFVTSRHISRIKAEFDDAECLEIKINHDDVTK